MKPTYIFKIAFIAMLLSINFDVVARSKKAKKFKSTEVVEFTPISGTITNEFGDAVFGAMVQVYGTNLFTISDYNGNYSLESANKGGNIIVTAENCQVSIVPIESKVIDIKLSQTDKDVQVSFAKQDKDKVTVATSDISGEVLKGRPGTSLVQMLQGAIPGLNITQNSGGVDQGYNINVRGTTTIGEGSQGAPLILIDGMEGDINSVNPNDVESVTLLKDTAAATLYGSRAPFGVILIVTKIGSAAK